MTRLKAALYFELGELYTGISLLSIKISNDQEREDFRNMLHVMRLDSYDFARANPDVFYMLPEARELQHIFSAMDFAKNHPGRPHDLALAMAFPFAVQSAVRGKTIDVKEFEKQAPQAFERIKKQLNLK